jgi:hypothetical protein
MLSTNAQNALEIACPQNHGSAVGGPGTDGEEIAAAIMAAQALSPAAAVAPVSAANAVDLPSAEALANANKVAINAIIAALIAAGLMV